MARRGRSGAAVEGGICSDGRAGLYGTRTTATCRSLLFLAIAKHASASTHAHNQPIYLSIHPSTPSCRSSHSPLDRQCARSPEWFLRFGRRLPTTDCLFAHLTTPLVRWFVMVEQFTIAGVEPAEVWRKLRDAARNISTVSRADDEREGPPEDLSFTTIFYTPTCRWGDRAVVHVRAGESGGSIVEVRTVVARLSTRARSPRPAVD